MSKFRSVDPHLKLQELYGDEFFVDIITAGTDSFNWDDENFIKGFDICHFHRTMPHIVNGQIQPAYGEDVEKIFKKFRKHNVTLVMDLDDYWMVSPDHPAWHQIKNSNLDNDIKHNLTLVDYVTTTTSIYAKEIAKHNKNVVVLPNTVDPSEPQFQSKPEPTDKKMRIGWLGGSSHLNDLKLASKGVSGFLRKHKEDTQFVLCGFDLRGNIAELNEKGEQTGVRKIKPEESVWVRYEELFTDNYKLVSNTYNKELHKYDESTDGRNEIYRRVWTKPITTYAQNYNLFDVSLAPVKEHMFNLCKSQLKVIEAGFHKKALITSDFGPYQIDLVNAYVRGGGINPDGNALLVEKIKNHKDWGKHLEFLYKNDGLVKQLGENLYKSVQKYHIDVVTKTRSEFYKRIVNGKQNEINEIIQETHEV